MDFRTFPKIPTHRSAPPRAVGGPWVALEKIHGAHLVIAVRDDEVCFGKRKQWLAPEDDFFGWQLIAGELAEAVRSIARATGAGEVFAYGELFGGAYPHPDVAPVPGLAPVQTGVWYAPGLCWYVFDLLIATGDDAVFLAHHEVEALAAAGGLRTPPVVGRGSRAELERLPVSAPTRVPAQLGLPPIEGNLAEGLVLKPDTRCAPDDRPVIKRKIAEFDDARFDESAAWQPGRLPAGELAAWVDRLVQPARIASARSKVGTDPQAIIDEVSLDVAIDLGLAFRDAWNALDGSAQEQLLARARAKAATLLD